MTRCLPLAAVLAWLAGAGTPGLAADETLTVRLSPAPRDLGMRASIAGSGEARVTLVGNRLSIEGTFAGFVTPATRAELRSGHAVAVRGPALHELAVTHATSGSFTGAVELTAEALAAYERGALYLQIASESAPDGNVWGWLLPASAPVVRDR